MDASQSQEGMSAFTVTSSKRTALKKLYKSGYENFLGVSYLLRTEQDLHRLIDIIATGNKRTHANET